MGGDQRSEENASLQSESPPQSVIQDPETSMNMEIPKIAPPDMPVTTPEENKEPSKTLGDDTKSNADNETSMNMEIPKIAPPDMPVTSPEENKEPSKTLGDDTKSNADNETKVIARPTAEDDHLPSQFVTNSKNRGSSTVQAKVTSNVTLNRGQIDTTAPFESVKAAVSMFGGIVDWKAHRVQTVERRKIIEQELERVQEEIPLYKKQSELAEEAKLQVLKELDSTKRLIEELKLNLERAQTEEQQSRQDSELAKLRVEEIEQGIADEASFAARAQLEVAQARHAAALSELKFVKDELEQLKIDYSLVLIEKDLAVKKAEEAFAWSKETERLAEDATIKLITAKESLESAQAAHLEAEEHRIGAVMAKEQDILNWEKELKNTEDEVERMTRRISASHDLKSKLDKASVLLQDLKDELAAYMESKLEQDVAANPDTISRTNIEAALAEAKKELDGVKLELEKANNEVSILRVATSSLMSELEREKSELAAIRQREGMAGIAVSSLESELQRTESEISLILVREKEEREKMVELPKKLREAALEADQEKALLETAQEELRSAKEEAERVRACAATIESRLRAAQKEIEAARASEKLASAAISALLESESDGPGGGVTLSLEEYYELSKRAHEAEERSRARVAASLMEIEAAKESEARSLGKLEEAEKERGERRGALEMALEKAERAKEGKLWVEQELRKWRAEHEQRRRAAERSLDKSLEEKTGSSELPVLSPKSYMSYTDTDASTPGRVAKKKKRSLFPKILMFLNRKKSSKKLSS